MKITTKTVNLHSLVARARARVFRNYLGELVLLEVISKIEFRRCWLQKGTGNWRVFEMSLSLIHIPYFIICCWIRLIALARSPTQLKLDDARIPQHRFGLRFKLCVLTKPFCCFARMIWPWLCFLSNCACSCSPNHFVFFSFLFGNSLNESAPGCNIRCHSITWRIAWMMLRGLLALIDLKLTCHYLHSYFRNFSGFGFGCRGGISFSLLHSEI